MDSPSHIHSIENFPPMAYSTSIPPFYSNTSITIPSPFYPSYISPFYSTYNTSTAPSPNHLYPNEASTPNLGLSHSYSPPSAGYYNPNGSENTEYSDYYYSSNYPVPPCAQVPNTATEPSATIYALLQKRKTTLTVTEMVIPIFDGTSDGYWWILCIERYFKARGIPEATKVAEAVTALHGPALQWWLQRYHHSKVSWESFTIAFLWQFKQEYRDVLPLLEDGKEEVNNKESMCLPFQARITLIHDSKAQGNDEEEAESELLGVKSSFVQEDLTGEEPESHLKEDSEELIEEENDEQPYEKEATPDSDLSLSMVKTSSVHFSQLSQNTLFEIFSSQIKIFGVSTMIAIMPKALNRYEQIFADEIFLPLTSCDVVLPIFGGVEIFYGEPPPPPKPPDRALVPHPPLLLLELPYQNVTLILETSSAYVFHCSYTLSGFHRKKKKKKKCHSPSTTRQRVFSTNRFKICVHLFWPISTQQTLTPTTSARASMSYPKLNCGPTVAHFPCASLLDFLIFYSAWLHGQNCRISNCASAFYPAAHLVLANMASYELLPPPLTHQWDDYAQHVFLYPMDLSMEDPINELVKVVSNAFSICFLINVDGTNSHAQPIQPLHTTKHVALIGNFFKTWAISCILELNASIVGFQYHVIIWLTRGWDPGGYLDVFTMPNSPQFKQWDPGDQISTSTRVRPSRFKQWDPGKLDQHHFSQP